MEPLMQAFRRSVAASLGYQPLQTVDGGQPSQPSRPTQQPSMPSAAPAGAPSASSPLRPGVFNPLQPHPQQPSAPSAPSAPGTAGFGPQPHVPAGTGPYTGPPSDAPAPPGPYVPPGYVPYLQNPNFNLPETSLGVNADLLASNPALQAYVTSLQSQAGQAHDAALTQLQAIENARANQYGQWGDPGATHFGDTGYGTFGMQREQLRNQLSARGLAGGGEHVLQDTNLLTGMGNQAANFEQQESTQAAALRSALLQSYAQMQAQLAAQALAGGFALPRA